MSLENLTAFFGWMAALNIGYLIIATLALTIAKKWMLGIHSRLFQIEERDLLTAYFNWLANYKIVALVFSIVPYIALRLI